jgi:hypothetical protein
VIQNEKPWSWWNAHIPKCTARQPRKFEVRLYHIVIAARPYKKACSIQQMNPIFPTLKHKCAAIHICEGEG